MAGTGDTDMKVKMNEVLKQYFGYDSFRPFQKEIITSFVMDRRDNFVLMATGNGKSICYQLPPLLMEKTMIVISPLIALIQDQVMALRAVGIKATFLGSLQTDKRTTEFEVCRGDYSLVYLTPEKVQFFQQELSEMGRKGILCGFAIDESHCLSEWGHEFRDDYLKLSVLRECCPDVPIIALTATATTAVVRDVIGRLGMRDVNMTQTTFNRPNLFYNVRPKTTMDADLAELFSTDVVSTIVYAPTRKLVAEIADFIKTKGVKNAMYHAGMDSGDREKNHIMFITDKVPIMVATIAYGLGINKPDIRRIIHYGSPKVLESYYQETGRAGRDGLESSCTLFYGPADFALTDFYLKEVKDPVHRRVLKQKMVKQKEFCYHTGCRRVALLQYFDETPGFEHCGKCDNCLWTTSSENKGVLDITKEARLFCRVVADTGQRFGPAMVIAVLTGSNAKNVKERKFDRLDSHGCGKGEHSKEWWQALARALVANDIVKVEPEYGTMSLNQKGVALVERADYILPSITPSREFSEIILSENQKPKTKTIVLDVKSTSTPTISSFFASKSAGEAKVEPKTQSKSKQVELRLSALRELRRTMADEKGVAPYTIYDDATLQRLAMTEPLTTLEHLMRVNGVPLAKVFEFGDRILKAVSIISDEQVSETEIVIPTGGSSEDKSLFLLRKGYAISDIATARGIAESTVETHLAKVIESGRAPEIQHTQFMTDTEFEVIRRVVSNMTRTAKLVELKKLLPASISYGKIKIAQAILSRA